MNQEEKQRVQLSNTIAHQIQRAFETREEQQQRQETDRVAHENLRAFETRNNNDNVKKLIG